MLNKMKPVLTRIYALATVVLCVACMASCIGDHASPIDVDNRSGRDIKIAFSDATRTGESVVIPAHSRAQAYRLIYPGRTMEIEFRDSQTGKVLERRRVNTDHVRYEAGTWVVEYPNEIRRDRSSVK